MSVSSTRRFTCLALHLIFADVKVKTFPAARAPHALLCQFYSFICFSWETHVQFDLTNNCQKTRRRQTACVSYCLDFCVLRSHEHDFICNADVHKHSKPVQRFPSIFDSSGSMCLRSSATSKKRKVKFHFLAFCRWGKYSDVTQPWGANTQLYLVCLLLLLESRFW